MLKKSLMLNNQLKNTQHIGKHSATFIYMISLIMYFPIMFYFRNFWEDSMAGYLIPNLLLLVIDGYLISRLYFMKTIVDRKCKILLLTFFMATVISFLVMRSGTERIISLNTILMSLLLYSICPIRKYEWETLYVGFVIVVAIILADNILDKKINTNTSGFLLSMVFCVSFARYLQVKKIRYLLCALIVFALQFFFSSRTAILGSVLFLIFGTCLRKIRISYKTVFYILMILALMGIIFAWFYSEVLYIQVGKGTLIIFGKDLFTGRENIWHYTFQSIEDNFWFGVGSRVNEDLINNGYDKVYSDTHNQPMGLLASFGIFAFLLFYIALSYIVARSYRSDKKKFTIPLIFISVISVLCYFETYFFGQIKWVAIILSYGLMCEEDLSYGLKYEE